MRPTRVGTMWARGLSRPGLAVGVCLWPVWLWYVRRLFDGADEPWGIVPLLFVLTMLARQSIQPPRRAMESKPSMTKTGDTVALAFILAVYCLCHHFAPPLVRAILGMTALSIPISRILKNRRFDLALWGLLILSLPVISSLQFYAGYPSRAAVAHGAAAVLRMSGTGVHAAGAALQWGVWFVDVDGPCSGIKSLWTGALLVCLLAYSRHLRGSQTALFSAAALGVILVGNIFRAAALFYLEAGMLPFRQTWMHNAIGLVAFGAIALAVWGLAHLFPPEDTGRGPGGDTNVRGAQTDGGAANSSSSTGPRRGEWFGKTGLAKTRLAPIITGVFTALCLSGALLPLTHPAHAPTTTSEAVWPEEFEGSPLSRVSTRIPFGDAFPGSIAQFSDGARQILFKSVSRPSRLVHPSRDCYRGGGWRIQPAPSHIDSQDRRWSAFTASRDGRKIMVREIVTDSEGNSWSTVSAWYWSAVLTRTRPPWLLTVVVAAAEN
ncbi:MAG: archaeosortase/exosortase family protein [Lentisphaeria bacterium]|nr:archaeosortase/exosortase family protein [Lentisphaeria bacterium]